MYINYDPPSVFVLDVQIFDRLSNCVDIAVYAFIIRCEGYAYSEEMLMERLEITKIELQRALLKLEEIGFLLPKPISTHP